MLLKAFERFPYQLLVVLFYKFFLDLKLFLILFDISHEVLLLCLLSFCLFLIVLQFFHEKIIELLYLTLCIALCSLPGA